MQLALNSAWGLHASGGQIATVSGSDETAQAVSCAVRTFLGEVWYDTSQGVPHREQILGLSPPASLVAELIARQALTVPGVVDARCVITQSAGRQLSGAIYFTTKDGETVNLTLTTQVATADAVPGTVYQNINVLRFDGSWSFNGSKAFNGHI